MSLDIYIGDYGSHNATHNLKSMWHEARCYEALYESEGRQAQEIIPDLIFGLSSMLKQPTKYQALNPSNGWGSYDGAIDFLVRVIKDCAAHPEEVIHISK